MGGVRKPGTRQDTLVSSGSQQPGPGQRGPQEGEEGEVSC